MCIHIPFKEKAIMCAISQFSVHSTGNNILTGSKHCYTKETYINWGYTKNSLISIHIIERMKLV